jgi:hypothetical protein
MSQVAYINARIQEARSDSPLYGLQPVEDPSDRLIEVNLAALKWNIQQRRFGMIDEDCERLHAMSVELLELLKTNMPEKTGQASGWKIEKAHSILHKVYTLLFNISKRDISWYITYGIPG